MWLIVSPTSHPQVAPGGLAVYLKCVVRGMSPGILIPAHFLRTTGALVTV